MMLARGMPPAPLWRLRSKHTLSVIEEVTLACTFAEVAELFAATNQRDLNVYDAIQFTHGRVALVDALARNGCEFAQAPQYRHRLPA
jgi:hypothetical protein